MSTYTIKPVGNGFAVYGAERTRFLRRPKEVARHERLFEAEMHALHLVTQDYHKELDYARVANQIMSTEMCVPRANEEHIYTALSLAGRRPPSAADHEDRSLVAPHMARKGDDQAHESILEAHLGKPISMTTRVMFEERYMTWYGQNNPDWVDPRREREYDVSTMRAGRNRYANVAQSAREVQIKQAGVLSRIAKIIGHKVSLVFRNTGVTGPVPTDSVQTQGGR